MKVVKLWKHVRTLNSDAVQMVFHLPKERITRDVRKHCVAKACLAVVQTVKLKKKETTMKDARLSLLQHRSRLQRRLLRKKERCKQDLQNWHQEQLVVQTHPKDALLAPVSHSAVVGITLHRHMDLMVRAVVWSLDSVAVQTILLLQEVPTWRIAVVSIQHSAAARTIPHRHED